MASYSESTRQAVKGEATDNKAEPKALTLARATSQRSSSRENESGAIARRSFLPQRGQCHKPSASVNRTLNCSAHTTHPEIEEQRTAADASESMNRPNYVATNSHTNKQNGAKQSRTRLRSLHQVDPLSNQQGTDQGKGDSLLSKKPSRLGAKPPDAEQIGLNRTQSLRRPGSAGPSAQSTAKPVHSRAQSSSVISNGRHDKTRAQMTGERPKSLLGSTHSTSASFDPRGAKSSTRPVSLKHPASVNTEPDANMSTATKTKEPRFILDKQRDIAIEPNKSKEEARKFSRPAFSTLQQHYTPRKTGKATTSTFLHSAPNTGSTNPSAETVNLQSELLQLHLLHEMSAPVSKQWNLSSKSSLSQKFDHVVYLHQGMYRNESQGQEQMNLQALREWIGGHPASRLIEPILALSGPLDEIPSLFADGGRFQRVAGEFDVWITLVERIWVARCDDRANDMPGDFINGLGDWWKAENNALTRKLTSFLRDLEKLDQPCSESSIACVLTSCKELLGGVLQELRMMHEIEAGVAAQERDWVETRLKAIARDVQSQVLATKAEVPAWRLHR